MKIEKNAVNILKKGFLCDHCLGRQFAQLLSRLTNEERGKIIRKYVAFLIDSGEKIEVDTTNFYGIKFKNVKIKPKKPTECFICKNFFQKKPDKLIKKTVKKLRKIDFNNFLVGTILPDQILNSEEKIWEEIGIEFVESIKFEINRIIGSKLGWIFKKPVEFRRPDIVVLVDLKNNDVRLQINSLFIFGYYKKLKRGIPQCEWGTPGKYKTSIQQIVAKPVIKATKGKDNSFHGAGREDVDARCLDWRPFVIEINEPKKRNIKLKDIEKLVNKSKRVNVKGLRFSNKRTVVKIKTETGDKTYRVLIKLSKSIKKSELRKLKGLIGVINQRTPERVSHRRADLIRKRKVKDIKWKQLNRKTIELRVKASAGLYIKELVTGDNGRTKPSVSGILNTRAIPKELDVVKIEKPKGL